VEGVALATCFCDILHPLREEEGVTIGMRLIRPSRLS
jgi:hypothetical protein